MVLQAKGYTEAIPISVIQVEDVSLFLFSLTKIFAKQIVIVPIPHKIEFEFLDSILADCKHQFFLSRVSLIDFII